MAQEEDSVFRVSELESGELEVEEMEDSSGEGERRQGKREGAVCRNNLRMLGYEPERVWSYMYIHVCL